MKHFRALALVFVVGAAAYFAGNFLGDYLAAREVSSFKAHRDALTQAATAKHIQLGVGDTIPDVTMETLEGDTMMLWSVLAKGSNCAGLTRSSASNATPTGGFAGTYLVAVHPQCRTCVNELAEIARLQAKYQRLGPFVFVSAANPRECQEICDSLGLKNVFLYDHRGQLLYRFGMDIYPLVVVLDEVPTVQNMILGTLLESEIEGAMLPERRR